MLSSLLRFRENIQNADDYATWIKAAFYACTKTHSQCGPASITENPTTRLIHVGNQKPNGLSFLLEPKDILTHPRIDADDKRYISVSHCWVTSQQVTTTRETLRTIKSRNTMVELIENVPRCYRDDTGLRDLLHMD
jgi:hypothetical protein